MFSILNGLYCSPFCFRLSINTAAEPATSGAARLVPPKSANGPVAFLLYFVTLIGVKLYSPIPIKSGFGSPTKPGPLLENPATSPEK